MTSLKEMLNDERDEPLLLTLANIILTVIPTALLLYALPPSNVLGAFYVACLYVLWVERFILALHYSSHRRLFSKKSEPLNMVTEWVLAPFFGIPIGTYTTHHCVMHHTEDNGGLDLSSTEPYQRDSFLHFLHYWLRFVFLSTIELPIYCARRRRYGLLSKLLAGEALWLLLLRTLYGLRPVQTVWVFLVPFLVSSFLLMFGNWSQHIFIDPSKPESDYTLTYNCVDHSGNQRSFNDGYHIIHHINSRVHWSELPDKFIDTVDKHRAEDAFVFRGIGFFDVGFACMTGQLGWLADRLTLCSDKRKSKEELIALMKERLAPVKRGAAKAD